LYLLHFLFSKDEFSISPYKPPNYIFMVWIKKHFVVIQVCKKHVLNGFLSLFTLYLLDMTRYFFYFNNNNGYALD
jgi:hypothetical protein